MERADALEIEIQGVAARKYVPDFRMHEPVQRRAVHQDSTADTRADGDVHQMVYVARGSPAMLRQRRRIDIGVESDWTVEFAGKAAHDIGAAPAGLGGIADAPIQSARYVQAHRTE